MAGIQKQGPDFNIETYIHKLDHVIQKKLALYQDLGDRIANFKASYLQDKHF